MSKLYRLPYTLREPCEDTNDMYLAECPTLPGCRAWGETPELALEYLEDIAAKFLESYKERGKPLPPEVAVAGELVLTD